MEPAPQTSRARRWLVPGLIFVLALAVRLAYVAEIRGEPDFERPLVDAGYHDYWAWGTASGEWTLPMGVGVDPELASTPYFRPPLPAYWLAAIFTVFGHDHYTARLLGALLGAASCVLLWAIGARLFDRRTAALGGVLAAVYWILPYFDSEYREVGLLVFLYAASVLALLRYRERPGAARAALAGVLLGLAVLAKPNGLLIAAAAMAWMVWVTRGQQERRSALKHAGLLAAGVALCVAPVTLRNLVRGGDLVLVSSNGGINLYIGNNPEATGVAVDLPADIPRFDSAFDYPQIVRAVETREGRELSHSEVSRWFAARARAWAFDNPAQVIELALTKAGAFWSGTEIVSEKDLVAARRSSTVLNLVPLDFAAVFATALLGLVLAGFAAGRDGPTRPDRGALVLVLLFIGVTFLSYLPFFVTGRYRAPIIPLMLLLSAYGVLRVVAFGRERRYDRVVGCVAAVLALWFLNQGNPDVDPRDEGDALAVQGAQLAMESSRLAAEGRLDEAQALLQEAEARMREAVTRSPDNPQALSNLGMLLVQSGRGAEAIEPLERAIALDGGDWRPLQNLGLALVDQGKVKRAQQLFGRAQALASLDPVLPLAAGMVLRQARALDLARGHLERSRALDGDALPTLRELALVELAAGRPAAAEAVLRDALRVAPKGPSVNHMLGVALLEQGRNDDAVRQLEAASTLAPGNGAIQESLARARVAAGR
jgi:Flp pilus assembly protein TadD/4-amino-4-deoxy-L-arabinose transferase-like glycosyltransferase